jgi:hypothetical protein
MPVVVLALIQRETPYWFWPLLHRVRRFRTLCDRRVVVYHDRLLDGIDLGPFVSLCHAELDRLGEWFGQSLRGRLVVYLFAHRREFDDILRFESGGYPLDFARAILVAADNSVEELVPHELAHVLAGGWNPHAPPYLQEGLAVWLQPTCDGGSVDTTAKALLAAGPLRSIRPLVPVLFFSSRVSRYDSYILAGSFTGFLIARYGRDRYERLYRMCRGNRFGTAFKECLGITLEDAELQWREAVTGEPGYHDVEACD